MSYYADVNGITELGSDRPPRVSPVGDVEALQLQLSDLGKVSGGLLLALLHQDGVTVCQAAEFAAVCDQTARMALDLAEAGQAAQIGRV